MFLCRHLGLLHGLAYVVVAAQHPALASAWLELLYRDADRDALAACLAHGAVQDVAAAAEAAVHQLVVRSRLDLPSQPSLFGRSAVRQVAALMRMQAQRHRVRADQSLEVGGVGGHGFGVSGSRAWGLGLRVSGLGLTYVSG